MILGIPREILHGERRVAALPETVAEYVKMGFDAVVQSTAGEGVFRSDAEYARAGATIVGDAPSLFARADTIVKVKQPCFNELVGKHEVDMMRDGATLITFLHPAAPVNHAMIRMLAEKNITALTMDSIPRTPQTRSMDALSSMSTVTGYRAVLMAAERLPKFVPSVETALGPIKSARFLVVGAGVVGLQAIATAQRLGAVVQAVDIREEARKAAEDLGAEVVGFDVPADWLEKQRETLGPYVEAADAVILGILVPGEKAPIFVTEEMVRGMKPGSVIIDVAVDQGGNCELTEPGREIVKHAVTICGIWNIPGSMPVDASWLYANNVLRYVRNLFKHGIDSPDLDDEIVRCSLVTYRGKIVHQGTLKAMGVMVPSPFGRGLG